MQRRVAWAIFALTVVLAGVQTWLFLGWSVMRDEPSGWPVLTVGLVLWAALGAVIVGRRPRHRVAWLFIVGAALALAGPCLSGYAEVSATAANVDPSTFWSWSVWLALFLDGPVPLLLLSLLFLLFPTGHLPSRGWRPLLWVGWSCFAGLAVVLAVDVPPWTITPAKRDELYAGGWSAHPLAFVLLMALTVTLLAAAASVFVRLRHAVGVERQQLRWLAVSSSMVAVGFVLTAVLPWQSGFLGWLRVLPVQLSIVAVGIGAALAVLRYRLYDLDVVVNRAILLTASTLLVTAGYILLVTLAGSVLPAGVRDAFWPALLATAAVALAFQPLRHGVVGLADRLAFGPRAVPYEALADFGRRLEQAPHAADLLRDIAHAVTEVTGARRVVATLELPDGVEVGESWPTLDGLGGSADPVVFAMTERSERLGRVEVTMPPGRPLRPEESRLVERLLAQSALAVRNLRLETELTAQVAELGRQTAALEESRRRLLFARDEEKASFAAALHRTVLPHLVPLPDRIADTAHRTAGHDVPLDEIEAEQDAVTGALDELRRLVHGTGPITTPDRTSVRTSSR